jgi:hypothetical protein
VAQRNKMALHLCDRLTGQLQNASDFGQVLDYSRGARTNLIESDSRRFIKPPLLSRRLVKRSSDQRSELLFLKAALTYEIPNSKYQITMTKVSGFIYHEEVSVFRCQVSGLSPHDIMGTAPFSRHRKRTLVLFGFRLSGLRQRCHITVCIF